MGSKDGDGKPEQQILDDGSVFEVDFPVAELIADLNHQLKMAYVRRRECQGAYLKIRDEVQTLTAMKEQIEKIIEAARAQGWSNKALRLIHDIAKAMQSK